MIKKKLYLNRGKRKRGMIGFLASINDIVEQVIPTPTITAISESPTTIKLTSN